MAETAVLQAAVAEQTVKTLPCDGEKGGGMQVDVQADVLKKNEVSQDVDGKENKEQAGKGEYKEDDASMNVNDSSPCSSADVSLNNDSKHNGSSAEKGGDEGANKDGSAKKKRRHNRHKGGKNHRKAWKPYNKLSWDEKRKREDKETLRATKKRDELFASGLPMAPYNTTQFLMEDQDQPSPQATPLETPQATGAAGDMDPSPKTDGASASYESSEGGEFYDSPDDEDIFMEKEFSEAYENYHAERLQDLTKAELVKEYIELESKNAQLEKKMKEIAREKSQTTENESDSTLEEKARLKEEIRQLNEENAKLSRENSFLKVAAGKLKV